MHNKHKFAVVLAMELIAGAAHAENYYFRLRPSVQIENQDSFALRINGDRDGVVGSSFSAKAEASASRETLQFNVTGGSLPPGVSINATSGDISGRPMAKGRFNATITAKDAFSTASAPLSIVIYDALEVESTIPRYATVGKPYTATFKGLGGDQTYVWTLTGTPPFGLSLTNASSQIASISGAPTSSGVWDNLRANVADGADHATSSSPFSISVADPLTLSGAPSPIATVGELYSVTFASTGGHAPTSWTLTGAALPDGLSFADGVIFGTPTRPEAASGFIVRRSDVTGNSLETQPFSITVSNALSISGTVTTSGKTNVAYSSTLTAAGGRAPYQWESVGSALPTGLTFNNGTISGTPTAAQTSGNLIFRVTDADGRVAHTPPLSIAVAPPSTRQPVSGDYYSTSGTRYYWSIMTGGARPVNPNETGCGFFWANAYTITPCGKSQITTGATTYYLGSYRGNPTGYRNLYGVYRIVN